MPSLDRPDLSAASREVRAYVEALEAELARFGGSRSSPPAQAEGVDATAETLEPAEPPTTLNVVTISAQGLAKRTPRHLYGRQRRGGMGIFDLETTGDDQPAFLMVLDEAHDLLVLTNLARAFHVPVRQLPESPVRARGVSLTSGLPLQPGERPAAILPAGRGVGVALLTERGYARVLPAHIVGQSMTPGTTLMRAAEFGTLATACWTAGDGDLMVASARGLAIRFPERALALTGGLAIRLEAGDRPVAIEAVRPPDGEAIFLLSADGRGSIRLMSGFAANKAPGGGGKTALKSDRLVSAIAVAPEDDIFVISRLSKIIRFRANEVPSKEGVVQGVNCMSLRADECAALAASPLRPTS
jgi:DNA gyrase subunit A